MNKIAFMEGYMIGMSKLAAKKVDESRGTPEMAGDQAGAQPKAKAPKKPAAPPPAEPPPPAPESLYDSRTAVAEGQRAQVAKWHDILKGKDLTPEQLAARTPEQMMAQLTAAGYLPGHEKMLEEGLAKNPYTLATQVERARMSSTARGAELMRNRMLAGGGIGGAVGAGAGYLAGGDAESAGTGAGIGGGAGALGAAMLGKPARPSMATRALEMLKAMPK